MTGLCPVKCRFELFGSAELSLAISQSQTGELFIGLITEFNGIFREIIFAILGSNYERFLNGWTSK
jgi:hypothetical protein